MNRSALFAVLLFQIIGPAGCSRGAGPAMVPAPVPGSATIERYFREVRTEYSGDRAMEVVAFMEGTFRVPGNPGFDASIAKVVEVLDAAGYLAEAMPR